MAPQIDFMVQTGMLSEDAGRNHPDRSCLTSVLGGEDVPRIDCPSEPLDLQEGDILIAASDGIQYLSFPEIEALLRAHEDEPSRSIADALLARLEAHGDPEQDNATFTVVKVSREGADTMSAASSRDREGVVHARDREFAARAPSRLRSSIFLRGAALFRNSAQ